MRHPFDEIENLEQGLGCLAYAVALLCGAGAWYLVLRGIDLIQGWVQ